MLAGNADRERTVDVLRAAYAEGRLTLQEYEERVGRALASRTVAELQQLTCDVPHGPGGASSVAPQPAAPVTPHPAYRPAVGFGPPVYGQPVPLRPPPPQNGTAIGALVCGIMAPMTMGLTGVPAVILGHKARAEIRRSGDRGDGLAVAGLALGWIGVCFVALIVIGIVSS
ncbi:DUF1707 and DUF4190 domain-containing protein [Streptomyces sp. TR06-5]|uniref:DUF1707 and DUF4190 domain-containing protein n=1 Tax=unclassified Streptomyces TaxID=2593676 RepID=UPI0039A322DB